MFNSKLEDQKEGEDENEVEKAIDDLENINTEVMGGEALEF